MNGKKSSPDVGIDMPETKVSVIPGDSSTIMNTGFRRQTDVGHVILRLVCLITSVVAVVVMATSEQKSNISVYGFQVPVFSKWSYSKSFEYLVGISAATAAYSLLQLILDGVKLLKKLPVFRSQNHAWLIFIIDQVFAYAMISAGSAASGVTNLNRTGIKHSALPNFCKPLHRFCDRVAVSIVFTFFSCFLLATSAILDVIRISRY